MDLSPVYQAGPYAAACIGVVVLGVLLPGWLGRIVWKLGVLGELVVLVGSATYVGLGYACTVWAEHPQYAWVTLVCVLGVVYLITDRKLSKKRRHDWEDDEDDDGGLRVLAPAPLPGPPPLAVPDWDEFDALRGTWDRDTVGV